MKKYSSGLIVFTLLFSFFGFLTVDASVSGCMSGDRYSRTTGQACTTSGSSVCQSGDIYNSYTGERCSTETPFTRSCDVTYERGLTFGSRGTSVSKLQQILKNEGLLASKVDGVYGPMTDGARKSYENRCEANSSITVLSPNGGESWKTGTTQTIKWNVGNSDKTKYVNFELRSASDSSSTRDLYLQAPNTGSVTLTLPSSYTAGAYFLQLKTTDETLLDESNSYFTITNDTSAPYVTVLAPNGGESWNTGSSKTITWTGSNSSVYDVFLTSHNVACTTKICPTYVTRGPYTLAKNVSLSSSNSQGSFSWQVGKTSDFANIPAGSYSVKVCKSGTNTCDYSDNYFTVASSETSTLQITTSSVLPRAKVGEYYSTNIMTSGGSSGDGYFWTGDDGSAGFVIGGLGMYSSYGSSNKILGTPGDLYENGIKVTTPREFSFKLTVTNGTKTASKNFRLTVDPASSTPTPIPNTTPIPNPTPIPGPVPVDVSTVKVISPNGGEIWTAGDVKTITLNANSSFTYDISLVAYYPPCPAVGTCSANVIRGPYTLAKNISVSSLNSLGSYVWWVGMASNSVGIPVGSYTVKICKTGTSICDSSDSHLTINSTTNTTPVSSSNTIPGPSPVQ